MATKIVKIETTGLKINPTFSDINKYYNKLEVTDKNNDYNNLLSHLYKNGPTKWVNPKTTIELNRNSKIIISYLSHCFYNLHNDSIKINIEGYNLTYRDHVLNFIAEEYLYQKGRGKIIKSTITKNLSPLSPQAARRRSPTLSPQAARRRSPTLSPQAARRRSPTLSPQAARRRSPTLSPQAARRRSPTLSPQAARRRSPTLSPQAARRRSPTLSPQAARNSPKAGPKAGPNSSSSSKSSNKISYSRDIIKKTANSILSSKVTADKLTEKDCFNFIEKIKTLKKGLTADQIKELKIPNPITKKMINLKNPIFQNLLYKCYSFNNDELKKKIEKVTSKNFLQDLKGQIDDIQKNQQSEAEKAKEKKRLADEKKKAAAQAAIDKFKKGQEENLKIIEANIAENMKYFHECCDELIANCDINGVLSKFKYISKVVNAIVVIIVTKYLHLQYYYNDLYEKYPFDKNLPICLIMYDDTMKDYFESVKIDTVKSLLDVAYKRNGVLFQNNYLRQDITKTLIDNLVRSVDEYHVNTLINRQFIFDISKTDLYGAYTNPQFINPSIVYNKYNVLKTPTVPFKNIAFPKTLEYAMNLFELKPFNYNITNSRLPRYIFISTTEEVLNRHKPFQELIGEINERLAKMPIIKEIAKEATVKSAYYEGVLTEMKKHSFGYNDIIRKNIMYSLNAQTAQYVTHKYTYFNDIFYNQQYSGMFPLFTWVPININDINSSGSNNIYNMADYVMWQPFGAAKNVPFRTLGDAYKNYNVSPWSKMLNEAIYKVITKAHSSVKNIPNTQYETDRLIKRVKETLGVYKDMDISPTYKNNKVFLYHGSGNRLHTMKDRDNDIEVLGFLSTSLNIYTASYYSEIGLLKGNGYIYIIESDDKKGYINLNDQLYQFILLPNSIIRILYEFKFADLTIILCRLIMTPTKKENNYLYNNLLDIPQPARKNDSDDDAAGAARSLGGKGKESLRIMNTFENIKTMNPKHDKLLKDNIVYADNANNIAYNTEHYDHMNTANIIKPKKDIRRIGDMPKDIREYYNLTEKDDNEKYDISNGCYFRLISRKKVDKMINNKIKNKEYKSASF